MFPVSMILLGGWVLFLILQGSYHCRQESCQRARVDPTGAVGIHEAAAREHTTEIEMGLRKDIADGRGNSNSPKQGLQFREKRAYAV